MKTTEYNSSTLAWVLATLTGLGVAVGLYWINDQRLTTRYDQAEQRADSLLSVKLQLEGDLRDLKSQLETATDDTAYLNKRIANVHDQVNQRDQTVGELRRQNASYSQAIGAFTQQLSRLSVVRDSLEHQMMAMHDKIKWQNQANEQLSKQQPERQPTDSDAQTLTSVPHSAINGDAFLVEVRKSNKKVTAKAKKATTLTISFTIPAVSTLEGTQEVYLSLTDEQQQPMMPALHTATVTRPDQNEVIPVHATQIVNFAQNPHRISVSFKPENTIKPGIYRASVFTKDAYLGSVDFHLRDSFWFL
ncbi:hypothetical protein [Spirosoma agri]|uniref:Uncharacterized protein n=1 Tax=Spirosoma agri TaxID=1987381 RepID=A0A6M0IT67_9BACT|nr:hypothetical protein [Spirosoma agri]NEU70363.1 hypothetical protein [Spirosoma agri]